MTTSRTKQRIRTLYDQLGTELTALLGRAPVFAGYLYEQKAKCGKPQCKCAKSAYRHRLWCVSFTEEGQSRTRVVPKAACDTVDALTREYRRVRHARREAVRLFEELMGKVEEVTQVRVQEGQTRYARTMACAKGKKTSSARSSSREQA